MNRIVTEKCKTLRALARHALKDHWAEAVILALVCQLIIQIPGYIFDFLPTKLQTPFLATFLNVYSIAINGPLAASLCYYIIHVFRNENIPVGLSSLNFGKENMAKAIILAIRVKLITWLLSLLFIIPGVIAALDFSQAFFIMADDPTKNPTQCMVESKFIMRGNRIKFLLLSLSFIGWEILTSIPAGISHIILDGQTIMSARTYIMQGDLMNATLAATTVHPAVTLLLLLNTIVSVYIYASDAAFFDILAGKLVVQEYGGYETEVVGQDDNIETIIDVEETSMPQEDNTQNYEYKIVEERTNNDNEELQ